MLRDGGIEATYRKRELPNYAVFDERRYFDVDPNGETCVFEVKGAVSYTHLTLPTILLV